MLFATLSGSSCLSLLARGCLRRDLLKIPAVRNHLHPSRNAGEIGIGQNLESSGTIRGSWVRAVRLIYK